MTTRKIASNTEAFEEALRLAVFAPSKEKALQAIQLAEGFAAQMTSEQIAFSKDVVSAQIAAGTYDESDYA